MNLQVFRQPFPQINQESQMVQEDILNNSTEQQNEIPEYVPEFKKQLIDRVNGLFEQQLNKPKGLKHLYNALKLGESYEEEIVQYTSLQLHSEHFLSTFEKILELLHDTKALCLRIPEEKLSDQNNESKNDQNLGEHITSLKLEVQRQIQKGAKDLTICKAN